MNKYLASILMLCTTNLYAASAIISGEGRVLSEPDYVELSLSVQSRCYSTPEEARKANDDAANKIVAFLNKHISGDGYYNKVITQGGYTSPFQIYHRNQIICENTFQKNNNVTIRTQKVEDFEKLFDEIQKEVYSHFSQQPRSMIETAVTFVTMSQPYPGVSTERRHDLEQKAMTMALNDAKGKLNALFQDTPIQGLRVVEVSESPIMAPPPPTPQYAVRSAKMMSMEAADAAPAPVQFDDQWIYKRVYFRFEFEDLALQ